LNSDSTDCIEKAYPLHVLGYDRAMNRHLVIFLVFVVALLAAGAATAWWLGPQINLLINKELREQTVLFLDFSHQGPAAAQLAARDVESLAQLVREESGKVQYQGQLVELLDGKLSMDEWQRLTIYSLTTGADYFRLRTNPRFQTMVRAGSGRLVMATQPTTAEVIAAEGGVATVVWLLARRKDQSRDQVEPFLATVSAHGGSQPGRWELAGLEGDQDWSSMLVFDFPDQRRALAWHRDVQTRTEVAIMKARYRSTAGLLFRAVP
jgi:hypothetical protein